MMVYKCDLCDQIKKCGEKEIEGKFYNICLECWRPLEAKLKGKGRVRDKGRIEIPSAPVQTDDGEGKETPFPGQPPKIWMKSDTVN